MMIKVYTHKDGMLALKKERQEACAAAGVVVLEFGEQAPEGSIIIADARPRKWVGGRGPNDPAATMLYIGNTNYPTKMYHFEDFNRALKKALKLAKEM